MREKIIIIIQCLIDIARSISPDRLLNQMKDSSCHVRSLLVMAALGMIACRTTRHEDDLEGRVPTRGEAASLTQLDFPSAPEMAESFLKNPNYSYRHLDLSRGDRILSGRRPAGRIKVVGSTGKGIRFFIVDQMPLGKDRTFRVLAKYELLLECQSASGRSVVLHKENLVRVARRKSDGSIQLL